MNTWSTFFSALLVGACCLAVSLNVSATPLPLTELEGNNTRSAAQQIHAADFASGFSAFDPDVFTSLTVPHVTVRGDLASSSDVDYFSFEVGNAGSQGFFDIDQTASGLDTLLTLFNAAGQVLAIGNDNCSGACVGTADNDPGSSSNLDAYIGTYSFAESGLYYLAVSTAPDFPVPVGTFTGALTRTDGLYGGQSYLPDVGPAAITSGGLGGFGDYLLHISLTSPFDPVVVSEPPSAWLLLSLLPLVLRQVDPKSRRGRF